MGYRSDSIAISRDMATLTTPLLAFLEEENVPLKAPRMVLAQGDYNGKSHCESQLCAPLLHQPSQRFQ